MYASILEFKNGFDKGIENQSKVDSDQTKVISSNLEKEKTDT